MMTLHTCCDSAARAWDLHSLMLYLHPWLHRGGFSLPFPACRHQPFSTSAPLTQETGLKPCSHLPLHPDSQCQLESDAVKIGYRCLSNDDVDKDGTCSVLEPGCMGSTVLILCSVFSSYALYSHPALYVLIPRSRFSSRALGSHPMLMLLPLPRMRFIFLCWFYWSICFLVIRVFG